MYDQNAAKPQFYVQGLYELARIEKFGHEDGQMATLYQSLRLDRVAVWKQIKIGRCEQETMERALGTSSRWQILETPRTAPATNEGGPKL